MMKRQDRAKQFMPFDVMKGLQEALRDREERHSRVEKHEISEEMQEKNSKVLFHINKGTKVSVEYYLAFHDVRREARITGINMELKYLLLGEERIFFDDIYEIRITDAPPARTF